MMNDLDLGAHLTIAKGIPQGMDLAKQLGATCFQFFTRNPRGGRQREITKDEIAQGHARREATGLRTLIAHLPYVVNPASPDDRMWEFARGIVHDDLRLADAIGASAVVLHPGRHVGSGVVEGTARIAKLLRAALKGYHGRASLLLEAMAGQGSEIGSEPGELAAIVDACDGHPALGVCLDSCHQFSRGYDLRTPDGVDAMVRAFEAALGPGRLRCLHLNDCKVPLGRRLDRHQLVGQGHLGLDGIRAVVTHPLLATLPMCLETPVDDLHEYAGEIEKVRELTRTAPPRPRPPSPRRTPRAG